MKIVKKYSKKWKKVLKIKKSRTIIFLKKDTNKGEIYMKNKGITLIALTVTTIFCYDEFIKASNNKGFLLQTI